MNKSHATSFCNLLNTTVLTVVLTISATAPAHAYLDPGSTGALVTAILGFFAAIGYTFRKWFYKLKTAIIGTRPDDDDEDE